MFLYILLIARIHVLKIRSFFFPTHFFSPFSSALPSPLRSKHDALLLPPFPSPSCSPFVLALSIPRPWLPPRPQEGRRGRRVGSGHQIIFDPRTSGHFRRRRVSLMTFSYYYRHSQLLLQSRTPIRTPPSRS